MSINPLDYAEIIGNKLSDFKEIESIDLNGEKKNFTSLGCGFFGYTEKIRKMDNILQLKN